VTDRPVIRLATRGSPLALWQARRVARLLEALGVEASLITVETEGDRRTDTPLQSIGGQGVFVKEVQAAVVRGEADAAVHSAKDLPAASELQVPGLVLAAFPERADPRDLLVGATLETLGAGARVATGSARRRVQLANLRPDLLFTDLRGNLATRLEVAVAGARDVAAVVVAAAGVERLGWSPPDGVETEILDPMVMLPQVGQGALAVECRVDDERTRAALALIDNGSVRRAVIGERAYLGELGGGCTLPVGAYATLTDDGGRDGNGGTVTLTGIMGSDDGRVVLRHTASGDDPEKIGRAVARYLLDDAGGSSLGSVGDR
jgi:hydroxymethylbilane synthase